MNLKQIKKSEDIDITVLLATYNRAEVLRSTLEHFVEVDRAGLKVEFVVVDNRSIDNTPDIVDSYKNRLPLTYLFEPVPGKNKALNSGIQKARLGKIVVNTDDDITPRRDWLIRIYDSCLRNPSVGVYGGKVDAVFPDIKVPTWIINDPEIKTWGLAVHDYSPNETFYQNGITPHGNNFWIKRDLLEKFRFNENVGPSPTNRIMGGETELFKRILNEGHKIVYCPDCVVGHRVQNSELSYSGLAKRAYRRGRGIAVGAKFPRPKLFAASPRLWRLVRYGAIGRKSVEYALLLGLAVINGKYDKPLRKMIGIGFNVQSLKRAQQITGSLNGNR